VAPIANGNPIREEWEEYYQTLESIRESGITNMFGAAPYLKELHPELSHKLAQAILVNWMRNYTELNKRYGWRD
jgi:hypothetical protein